MPKCMHTNSYYTRACFILYYAYLLSYLFVLCWFCWCFGKRGGGEAIVSSWRNFLPQERLLANLLDLFIVKYLFVNYITILTIDRCSRGVTHGVIFRIHNLGTSSCPVIPHHTLYYSSIQGIFHMVENFLFPRPQVPFPWKFSTTPSKGME
jgi:hypothetical protein